MRRRLGDDDDDHAWSVCCLNMLLKNWVSLSVTAYMAAVEKCHRLQLLPSSLSEEKKECWTYDISILSMYGGFVSITVLECHPALLLRSRSALVLPEADSQRVQLESHFHVPVPQQYAPDQLVIRCRDSHNFHR